MTHRYSVMNYIKLTQKNIIQSRIGKQQSNDDNKNCTLLDY